jgi:hypothetical protein
MDLFHAVTQSIENVLTCDWYDSFKQFKMSDGKTMDTVPGGETPQYVQFYSVIHSDPRPTLIYCRYESIKTTDVPPEKQSGQLGGASATHLSPHLD